jgi:membrane-bound lytic murein transglycosylase B
VSLLKSLEAANNSVSGAGAFYGKLANPVKHTQGHLDKAAEAIQKAGEKFHVNPAYIWGIYGTETSFGSHIDVSATGARGPFQFEPETAKQFGYPLGVNEHGITSWSAFTKQAEATAKFLVAHGGVGNPRKAVEAYNPGEASYYSKVVAHAKSFHAPFASEAANKAETATTEEAKPEKGSGLIEQIFGKLGGVALNAVLLLAGAVLVVYGIMVAIRPRESALSIPRPI